jgi:hypothetical protein
VCPCFGAHFSVKNSSFPAETREFHINHRKERISLARYEIIGGTPLTGEVTISGAKNAAVAILPAALLVAGPCRIENVPNISDVRILLDILEDMGAKISYEDKNTVCIDSTEITSVHPKADLVRKMRASYYLMGALLGRFGRADVALPGGCNFASRPIDQHIKGFRPWVRMWMKPRTMWLWSLVRTASTVPVSAWIWPASVPLPTLCWLRC